MKNSQNSKLDEIFIESFFRMYFDYLKPDNPKEELYEILNMRGFLLEPFDEKNNIKLSDNSFFGSGKNTYEIADNDFLKKRISSFAELNDNNELCIFRDTNMLDYVRFLINREHADDITRIGQETGPRSYNYNKLCSFDNLKNLEYGLKISVSELEPFIAKLIKSVNSIGLDTSMSCQGHSENGYKSDVYFYGCYNLIWFIVVFEKFVSRVLKISCNWTISQFDDSDDAWGSNVLTITHPDGDLLSQYFEILKVADFIYDNRLFLRRMKRGLRKLNDNDVYNSAKIDMGSKNIINYKNLKLFELFSSVFNL